MIGNKITHKTTNFVKTLPQNSSKTVESGTKNAGFDEIPKERYVSPKKKHKTVDDLRLR